MWIILLILCASLASATLYRMGGSGRYPRQARVIGIPLLTTALAYLLGVHSWWLVLSFGLTIASISTYWDFACNNWDNHYLHGFFIGLSAFPIAIVTGHWWLFIARALILAVFMGLWSRLWGWDIAEETGRGFVIPATLWMVC